MEVPRAGDRSLQTFGDAAPDDEFAQIGLIVRAYYIAQADRDIPALCGLLADEIRQGFVTLAKRDPQRPDDASCATVLRRTSRDLPPPVQRAYRRVRVTDARTDDRTGFAFLTIPGQGSVAVTLRKNDDQWKIATMGGIPLY